MIDLTIGGAWQVADGKSPDGTDLKVLVIQDPANQAVVKIPFSIDIAKEVGRQLSGSGILVTRVLPPGGRGANGGGMPP